jgi:hypothetical protein
MRKAIANEPVNRLAESRMEMTAARMCVEENYWLISSQKGRTYAAEMK